MFSSENYNLQGKKDLSNLLDVHTDIARPTEFTVARTLIQRQNIVNDLFVN